MTASPARPPASNFVLSEGIEVLARTPHQLRAMLDGLSGPWRSATERPGTWSPHDIIGHLVHGEMTDWIVRARQIRADGDEHTFEEFDRRGHEAWWGEGAERMTVSSLLDEFARRRAENLDELRSWNLDEAALALPGRHPDFGPVTMQQLLATWVAHDLHHTAQIARVMARRYAHDVGPWAEYLSIVRPLPGR